jgi:hypothetical protein
MKTKFLVVALIGIGAVAWAASALTKTEAANMVFEANVSVGEKLVMVPKLVTIADDPADGGSVAATLTLVPYNAVQRIHCDDTDGCAITLAETKATSGQLLVIANAVGADAGGGSLTLADTAGVQELSGNLTLGLGDTVVLVYSGDRWLQLATSNN